MHWFASSSLLQIGRTPLARWRVARRALSSRGAFGTRYYDSIRPSVRQPPTDDDDASKVESYSVDEQIILTERDRGLDVIAHTVEWNRLVRA